MSDGGRIYRTDSLTIEQIKMFENTGDSLFYLFQNRFWISGRVLEGFLNIRKVVVEIFLLFYSARFQ